MRGSFGVGNLSLPQFDPWLLERVEVLRGPGSMLYGQSLPGELVTAGLLLWVDGKSGSLMNGIGGMPRFRPGVCCAQGLSGGRAGRGRTGG